MITRVVAPEDPLAQQVLRSLRHDVYHLPEYLRIEARRTSSSPEVFLVVDGERMFFVPYLLRRCGDVLANEAAAGGITDAVSPYGYPGILLSPQACARPGFADVALRELADVLRTRGVCSAFFRMHPILNDAFGDLFASRTFVSTGQTVSIDLRIPRSQLWSQTRKGHQSTINRCKRLGFTARMVPVEQFLDEFIAVYRETMDRVGADDLYYFSREYFTDLLALGERLHLCIVESNGRIAAATLFFECCGFVQAHLGGTRTEFLPKSPHSLLVDYVRVWAQERGNQSLHLGGGVGGRQDALFAYKTGFSRQRHTFLTLRLITDEEKYRYLVDLRARSLRTSTEHLLKSDFFPAYRSPLPRGPIAEQVSPDAR